MPYKIKGKCIYNTDTDKKVGCTKKDPKKYLKALYANVPDAKSKLKEVIKKMITEMLTEDDDNTISDKQEKEVVNFDQYLKLPQNIGISFTQKEKDATNIPNLRPPFSKSMFEIRYKSVEDTMDNGQMIKTNKTTVVKKIRSGSSMMYKTFTLLKPTEKPEELKEAGTEPTPPPQVSQPPKPAVPPVADTPQKPPMEKVIEVTSNSFENVQGDIEKLVKFLKDVNEDLGL
jgi:hypothetical protein